MIYSTIWRMVSGGWCGDTPLCCLLCMTDFIVICVFYCEFDMLAKNKIK